MIDQPMIKQPKFSVTEVFPEYIDNTMLKNFTRCPQYFFRRHIQGVLLTDTVSIDLHFGGSFAAGIEAARKAFYVGGLSTLEARDTGTIAAAAFWRSKEVLTPPNSAKTFNNLLDAVWFYFDEWPLGGDGLTPLDGGIEYQFEIPLQIPHPETQEELVYVGRMDLIARDEEGRIVVVDEKTASPFRGQPFSDAWLSQWDMDPQLSGYLYVANTLAPSEELPIGNIRGVCVGRSAIEYTTIPVFRSAWHLSDWWHNARRKVAEMAHMWCMQSLGRKTSLQDPPEDSNEAWIKFEGSSCTAYARPCEYTRLCTTPNPSAFLEGSYTVSRWNPRDRTNS